MTCILLYQSGLLQRLPFNLVPTSPMTDSIYIIGALSAVIFLTELLVRKTWMKHLGTAILVIVFTAVLANLGLLPTGSTADNPVPAYDFIFSTIAPLAIFWLLLPVNLRDILKAGKKLILFFLFGSMATAVGVFVGMWVIDGAETIGPLYNALGGMFVGTYTGGSVNFNSIGLHYNMMQEGVLYGGAIVVDNIITTFWMITTLSIPKLLSHVWPKRTGQEVSDYMGEVTMGIEEDSETIHPIDLGILLALGLGSVWLSEQIGMFMPSIPTALILTVIALILAQVPQISKLPGLKVLGMFAVYLFLCVIGAYCDLAALGQLGSLGVSLLIFTAVTVTIHGILVYGLAYVMKVNPVIASIASQANVGGGTSALALARSFGREDLVLPSILIGSLGYAVGTFLGFWVAESWLPLLG
ncbi:MAG: DUF819 family protein [Bacteroidetes bacterium]|nr:DUF819 family protein [Bacteroidota bacterium]